MIRLGNGIIQLLSANKANGRLDVFSDFYNKFESRHYKKGEVLIRADDNPQGVFCLTKGYVRQYTLSKGGAELTLHILKPVSYFPMTWAVNDTFNIYYFEALTPVEAGRAPREEVIKLIRSKPELIFDLMKKLLEEHDETLARIGHLVFSDAYRRALSVLIYLAKHFGEDVNGQRVVKHRFTHQNIATLVGVARETASNEINKLEKKGLIKYVDHAIVYKGMEELEAELYSV